MDANGIVRAAIAKMHEGNYDAAIVIATQQAVDQHNAAVMHSAEISAEAMQHADRALELQSELAKEYKALRSELRRL